MYEGSIYRTVAKAKCHLKNALPFALRRSSTRQGLLRVNRFLLHPE